MKILLTWFYEIELEIKKALNKLGHHVEFIPCGKPMKKRFDVAFIFGDKKFIPKDINNDDKVDILDVEACRDHILQIKNFGQSADVNKDGIVDVLDLQEIVNFILEE